METRNLGNFFSPSSVAIVGASHTPGKLGYIVLQNFLRDNFIGNIFPINPDTAPIMGIKVYASIKDVPEKVGLAVVVVPAEIVPKVVKECVEEKIPNIIVISGGFSEIGGKGIAFEQKVRRIIESSKGRTRLIGPNCVGVLVPKTKVDTVFLSMERMKRPKEGNIAFISQSGAVGSTVLDWLAKEGIGISKFVSYGNGVDVNEADLLEFMSEDNDTRVIAMYIEGMKSAGEEFFETLRNASRKKPLVVLKAGKSERGSMAAASHTGSLAGSSKIYSAAFRQTGAIEAENWEELFDFVKAFSMQPLPRNNRLIIITDGGGFGVLATDEAERSGVQLPEPSGRLKKALRSKMPPYVVIHNPIDVTGDADVERYVASMEATLANHEYDGAVVISLMQVPTLDATISDAISSMARFGKPILACAVGSGFTDAVVKSMESKGIPVFPTPERAVKAFSAMWRYKKFLASR